MIPRGDTFKVTFWSFFPLALAWMEGRGKKGKVEWRNIGKWCVNDFRKTLKQLTMMKSTLKHNVSTNFHLPGADP